MRAWWSGSLGTCPETFSVGRAALERGHQVRHVTSPWCVRGFLQFSYSSQVRSLCSSFLSKRNTTRSYSSVQTAAMATSTDSSADSKLAWRNLIQQLTPHIYIHLARSRFKDNSQLGLNPENEFRQGWAQEDDIKRLLLQIFQNYVQNGTDPLEVNAKLLIQDTVNAVNKQFQSGASNYSLDGVVEAENVRLNEKLVDEIRYQGDRSHELLREQLALETKTLDEAINKYRSISYDLQKRGKGSAMKPAERMMLSWFTPAIKAVEERLKHFEVTHHQRAPYKGAMLALGPAVLTTVALHEIVNMILNSPGGIAYTHAAKVMGKAVELEVNRHMLQQDKAVWKDVTRQCKYNNRKETVINRMAEALYERGRWDAAQTIRCGAVLLDILIETAAVPGEVSSYFRCACAVHYYVFSWWLYIPSIRPLRTASDLRLSITSAYSFFYNSTSVKARSGWSTCDGACSDQAAYPQTKESVVGQREKQLEELARFMFRKSVPNPRKEPRGSGGIVQHAQAYGLQTPPMEAKRYRRLPISEDDDLTHPLEETSGDFGSCQHATGNYDTLI